MLVCKVCALILADSIKNIATKQIFFALWNTYKFKPKIIKAAILNNRKASNYKNNWTIDKLQKESYKKPLNFNKFKGL